MNIDAVRVWSSVARELISQNNCELLMPVLFMYSFDIYRCKHITACFNTKIALFIWKDEYRSHIFYIIQYQMGN